MKSRLLIAAAAISVLSACSNGNNGTQTVQTAQNQPIKEVEGRKTSNVA
ncbi:MAG: hypothetical protein II852_09480 [Bacteroidales bacterium]|nr:hypothetical protein [Bacteroidales bacterium]